MLIYFLRMMDEDGSLHWLQDSIGGEANMIRDVDEMTKVTTTFEEFERLPDEPGKLELLRED